MVESLSESGASLVIAVLMGGASGEREVSLKTGAAVSAALVERGHRVLDVVIGSDGLTWQVNEDCGSPLGLLPGVLADVEVFWIALHGGDGEGGTIQGFFESLGLAHTGAGVAASALCMDKLASLRFLRQEGLRIAGHCVFSPRQFTNSPKHCLDRARNLPGVDQGLSVKPRRGGSSVATTMLTANEAQGADLVRALEAVFAEGDDALVEARICGVEVTCPVIEDATGTPIALQPIEIRPKEGRFFDYEEKYSESGAQEFCPPRSLETAMIERLQALGLRAHRATGCSGYSRTDFIVPLEDRDQTPVLLEVNTLPGMTPRSLFPLAARQAGMDFGELCERLAMAAVRSK